MLHGRKSRQKAILRRERNIAGIHRLLQVFDQGVEIGIGQVQALMRCRHGVACIVAGAIRDHAKLVLEFGAKAVDV